jgi:hypothetical protein
MTTNPPRLIGTCLILLASSAAIAQSSKKEETRSIGKELDVWVTKTEQQLVPAAGRHAGRKIWFCALERYV